MLLSLCLPTFDQISIKGVHRFIEFEQKGIKRGEPFSTLNLCTIVSFRLSQHIFYNLFFKKNHLLSLIKCIKLFSYHFFIVYLV